LEIKRKTQTVKTEQKIEKKEMRPQFTSPNNTLFVENLTPDISEAILKTVFGKFNGFKEVRLFTGKGIAFIEYDTDMNAGTALLGLNNMPLTNECTLHITFAKK
jgi:U2 small nuclear ribonucleoprotein B''